jgi:hypothetical protein
MAAGFFGVRFRGILTTSPSPVPGGVSSRCFLVVRLTVDFFAGGLAAGATSAPVECSLTGSGASLTLSIEGASGAEEGGPAGRLAARRRRGAG